MNLVLTILMIALGIFLIEDCYAIVYIPEKEYKGYFSSQGLYTVVGKVISTENTPVKPTIHLTIMDNNNIINKSIEWAPIMNVPSLSREMPFKIIVPEVKSKDPKIEFINATFKYINRKPIAVVALYDNTLNIYNDHVSGKVINLGNETVYNIRLYAGAHALDGSWLDTSISEIIDELKPGESKPFTLYIDPIFYGQAGYYSCFAPSDPFVLNLTTTRNNIPFEVYSESVMWLYNSRFDNNILYINSSSNSTPLPMLINIRLPISSMNEQLRVYMNNQSISTFQRMDEDTITWHLTFEYPALAIIDYVEIRGFEEMNYKYTKLDINDTRVIIQTPNNIMLGNNDIKLVFYNKTNDKLIRNINYNIQLIQDNNIILDENRETVNGIDIITYNFNKEGDVKINVKINDKEGFTTISVIPEFSISIIVITLSIVSMLVIRYIARVIYHS